MMALGESNNGLETTLNGVLFRQRKFYQLRSSRSPDHWIELPTRPVAVGKAKIRHDLAVVWVHSFRTEAYPSIIAQPLSIENLQAEIRCQIT